MLAMFVAPAAASESRDWNAWPGLGSVSHGEPLSIATGAEAEDIRRWATPPLVRRTLGRALEPESTLRVFRPLPHRKIALPAGYDRPVSLLIERNSLPLLL